jgi:TonB family protein
MNSGIDDKRTGILLNIPLVEERYGQSFFIALAIHAFAALFLFFGGFFYSSTPIRIGSGPGGGSGGDISTVGVVDELSGGAGMIKPSLTPKPPALQEEIPRDVTKAIPLPKTVEPKKKKNEPKPPQKEAPITQNSNVIPTAPEPGSGGVGGRSGGSGGGIGGGNGVSIGTGSGGFGDSWYARTVEARISSNWIRPPEGVRVEITYSFYIAADGTINGIKQEKSSGRPDLDLTAERAIRASNPLAAPPPEFRGRLIQFVAQFIYPPNQ